MRLTVIGAGYVGLVTAACLANVGNHVICLDKDKAKIQKLKRSIIPIYEPGLVDIVKRNIAEKRLVFTTNLKQAIAESLVIFIAVGTPSTENGSADISEVLSVASQIAKLMDSYRIIVTKSTVPVGTYKKVCALMASKTNKPFDYVSSPEFLKEGFAVEDFMKPDRVIIGTKNPNVRKTMEQIYAPFIHKKNRMIFMDPASAEITKYAANAMLATRISFMNEMSALCSNVGADVELVRKGIGSDLRIGNAFLSPGVGYGGGCFPKDIRALIHMGNKNNCPMTISRAIQQANHKQQDRFVDRVLKYYKNRHQQIMLGIWGLAFKAQTNDIRESPAIYCIKKFINAGIKIKAYDPQAMSAVQAQLNGQIKTVPNNYDVLDGANALVILTDWQEFRTPDFGTIASKLKKPVIFDGRNLYDPDYVRKHGIEYYSIGRPH